jgi:hypothetical protein
MKMGSSLPIFACAVVVTHVSESHTLHSSVARLMILHTFTLEADSTTCVWIHVLVHGHLTKTGSSRIRSRVRVRVASTPHSM